MDIKPCNYVVFENIFMLSVISEYHVISKVFDLNQLKICIDIPFTMKISTIFEDTWGQKNYHHSYPFPNYNFPNTTNFLKTKSASKTNENLDMLTRINHITYDLRY